ncbi:MAG: YggT family protein [Candidatus Competibacterales bacterium]
MPYTANAGVFLIQALFGLYILAVMLRFLLQLVRANFYNPLVQVLVKVTNPPLIRLRRFIPGLWGIDLSAVVLLVVLQVVELLLIFAVVGQSVTPGGVAVLAGAELLSLLLNVFFWSVLIVVILSWVNPDPYHPGISVLRQLTEPVLRPARQLLPPVSGLDLSPILVMIALQLGRFLVIDPLRDLGIQLSTPGGWGSSLAPSVVLAHLGGL